MKQKSWELDIGNDHITYFRYSDYLKAKAKLEKHAFITCIVCKGGGGFWSGSSIGFDTISLYMPCHNCGGRGMVDNSLKTKISKS